MSVYDYEQSGDFDPERMPNIPAEVDPSMVFHDDIRVTDVNSLPLHVCRDGCGCEMVYPLWWEEGVSSSDGVSRTWEMVLRCPECEHQEHGIFDDKKVEYFDEELNDGTEWLLEAIRLYSRKNMEEWAESFTQAVERGHILPEDF